MSIRKFVNIKKNLLFDFDGVQSRQFIICFHTTLKHEGSVLVESSKAVRLRVRMHSTGSHFENEDHEFLRQC